MGSAMRLCRLVCSCRLPWLGLGLGLGLVCSRRLPCAARARVGVCMPRTYLVHGMHTACTTHYALCTTHYALTPSEYSMMRWMARGVSMIS